MLFCHQCPYQEMSPSSCPVLLPSTCLKLFWLYNLQLLIFASQVLSWLQNRVTRMLEKSLGKEDVTYTFYLSLVHPGIDSALHWRCSCECVAAPGWALGCAVSPDLLGPVSSSLQTPGAAPRSHCCFFLSSISLVLSKAALPCLWPCHASVSPPFLRCNPDFPNSFSNDSQLEWLEIPTYSIQTPGDLKS